MEKFRKKTIIVFCIINLIIKILCDVPYIPKEQIYTASNNLIIDCKVDSEIALKFDGIPTTGYTWILSDNSDETLLKNLNLTTDNTSKDYITVKPSKKFIVGFGGFYFFKFKPLKIGVVTLHFVHKRLWENENIEDIVIHVYIK